VRFQEGEVRLGRIEIGRAFIFGTAFGGVALLLVWSQRQPIAVTAIDRVLAARGVRATYTIAELGFRRQRIENLRLGDPARPDLIARRIDLSLVPSWSGVAVTTLAARGVHVRGSIVGGRLNLGELDKLIAAPSGKPFALPDIDVALADAHLDLATAVGDLKAEIAGSGRLKGGFQGSARVAARSMGRDGCRLERPTMVASVTTLQRRTMLAGALTALPSACASAATGPIQMRFDIALGEAFDRWTGRARIETTGIRFAPLQIAEAGARLAFAGSAAATDGNFTFASPAARSGGTRMAGLSATGRFDFRRAATADGTAYIGRVLADPALATALHRAAARAASTPVGPIAAMLARAVADAGAGASGGANFFYGGNRARVSALSMTTPSGARLTLPPIVLTEQGLSSDGEVRLSGGGFPSLRGHLALAPDGSSRGVFVLKPYRAEGAELAMQPVRFASQSDGTMRIETTATLDGPLGDGRAEGVRVPIAIQRTSYGDLFIGAGCVPIAYRRIAIAGAVLAPGSVILCAAQGGAIFSVAQGVIRGGARTDALKLTGHLGAQPLRMSVAHAAFTPNGPVSASNVVVLLGPAERQTRLRVAQLAGTAGPGRLSGRFAGLSGSIAQVPFLASAGQGRWSLADADLQLAGSMTLADQAEEARFNPLLARDVKLQLRAGRIAASAGLVEPVSGRPVTVVSITHELSRSVGQAHLFVDGLTFSKSLQPESITPLTTGVVADVYGQINGTGSIRWNGDKVTSSGRFRSDGLDFAAAFGPVTGASGEIEFDDLIALSTPPGQQVNLALVNPGVEVKDGTVAFRLRPNQIVDIEGGRWPFAGGDLFLDRGTLDLGQPNARRLLFRVAGLDAAKFIEQLKLENIAATGTFDGALPIVFDPSGGQIVGGQLIARAGGGRLAYVGEISNAETNRFAKLAFDALKSIRYDNLAIDLDGSLDGEIVSLVRFDGVNQSPVAPAGLARSFTNLPFKFNIRVRAPFRGLVNTARSYQDPGLLLNRTVQPVASDKRP